jgi:hypothetical protein
MRLRGVISIYLAVIALLVVQALPAFQAADTTETVTKKAKKATKATKDAVADTSKKATAKSKKALETGTVKEPGSAAADTAKRTTGRAERAESSASGMTRTAPAKIVSDSEIAAAKASGKVWVNTQSGVYHKGGQWYGATKQGKFMTEEDAKNAGYHAAKK